MPVRAVRNGRFCRDDDVYVRQRTEFDGHMAYLSSASAGLRFVQKGIAMNMQLSLAPIIALLAGILILVQPRLLNYIVAIYLIIIGLLGLFGGAAGLHLH